MWQYSLGPAAPLRLLYRAEPLGDRSSHARAAFEPDLESPTHQAQHLCSSSSALGCSCPTAPLNNLSANHVLITTQGKRVHQLDGAP